MTALQPPPDPGAYAPIVARRRSAEFVAIAKQTSGMTLDVFDYINPVPWVAEAYLGLFRYLNAPYVLSAHQAELCSLVVSYEHSCRYCHGASRTLLKYAGMREEQIRRLEQDLHGADLSPEEKRLLDAALKISRGTLSRDDVEGLHRAGFDRLALLELAFLVAGTGCFTFRVVTPLSLPIDSAVTTLQHPLAQAMRGLIHPVLRGLTAAKRERSVPFPEPNEGPFSRLVETYRPLPNAAALLRRLIDRAFASPALSTRIKGLIVGVVARAMGDVATEAEAQRLLVSEGMASAEIAQALDFLHSPTLSVADNHLLTFARDTVKYEAVALQERARTLKDQLSDEALIEALGICALANSVVRLSLMREQV